MTVAMLADLALRAALPIAVVVAVRWWLGQEHHQLLQRCWTAVALTLVLLPVITLSGARWELLVLPRAADAALPAIPTVSDPQSVTREIASSAPAGSPAPGQPSRPVMWWAAYLAGVVGVMIRRVRGEWTVMRIVRRAARVDPSSPLGLEAAEWARRYGIAPPRMRCTREVPVPCVAGVLRPTLLLPADVAEWSPTERCSVLGHELGHLRRGDLRRHAGWELLVAVWWWHPLVWVAASEVRRQSEFASDVMAIPHTGGALRHATALVAVARRTLARGTPTGILALEVGSALGARVRALLRIEGRGEVPSSPRWVVVAVTSVALSAAVLVPVARPLAHATELVSARNVSTGGQDVSSNAAGLQARWVVAGRQRGLFLSRDPAYASLRDGRVATGAVVLEVVERAGGVIATERREGDALDLDATMLPWLRQVARMSITADHGATPAPAPPAPATRSSRPRTAQVGLPARSDDPTAGVIQAGWIQDGVRYAVMRRGTWQVRNGLPEPRGDSGWLVLHGVDLTTGASRLSVLPAAAGAPPSRGEREWATAVYRAFEAVVAP